MKRPAVFFDRDNTLIANDGYLGDPAKVRLIAGAADTVAGVRALGFATVVVSNQSGVARGLFSEDDVRAVDAEMDAMLLAQNPAAIIDRHEFCPFHPQATVEQYRQDSPLRKPNPGMLRAAAEALALDLSRSWVIGDAPRDIAAGKNAGCRTVLFVDPELPASPAAKDEHSTPDHTVTSLIDAVHFIARSQLLPLKKSAAISVPPIRTTVVPSPLVMHKSPPAAGTPPLTVSPSVAQSPKPTPPAPAKAIPRPATVPDVAATGTPPAPLPATAQSEDPVPSTKMELIAEQILFELRRQNIAGEDDFSVSKLLAGVVQVLVLATLLLGYLQSRGNVAWLQTYLLVALTLQTMTIALLIMSRQK